MQNNISLADGYTEEGYLAEVPGIHGPLRFQYRPMLLEERDAIEGQQGTMDSLKFARVCITNVQKRLVSWDNQNAAGETLEITYDNVKTLRPHLADKVYLIIAGKRASDQDPNKAPAAGQDNSEMEAILAGESIGAVREGADAKN